ncbi:hypothetical protein [Reichenbachiella sp.]|uniref:hypothetical protein n=1 Tax=Reichenbachiella sp. TaxID=2184521 RepID=UPI003BAE8F3D
MKRTVLFQFILIITPLANSVSLWGQVTSTNPEIIDELISRTLIVEQLETDQKTVDFYDKKIANAKKQNLKDKYTTQKGEYLMFPKKYNELISRAANKILKSHPSIEYKTSSEVEQLRKIGSSGYTVLYYEPFTTVGSNLHIKSIKYSRIESKKADYSFFLPAIPYRDETEIMEYEDYKIALKLMINHLEATKAQQNKNYSFHNYAKDQSTQNCSEKSRYSLTIDQKMVQKNESKESMSKAFGNSVNPVPTAELLKLIENDVDQIIALAIPLNIVSGTSPANTAIKISSSNVNVFKCLVNTKTGKILAATGQKASVNINSKELKKLGSCK